MELSGEFGLAQQAERVERANLAYLRLIQLGAPIAPAAPIRFPILLSPVSVVLSSCPQEQMVGPHARRIVAEMQDAHPERDLSLRQYPCDSVRHLCPATEIESPIGEPPRAVHSGRLPFPASVATLNLLPEAGTDRARVAFVDSGRHRSKYSTLD